MSRFYSGSYKWALYEKYRNGATITALCTLTGITDKPLREWFAKYDRQCAMISTMGMDMLHGNALALRARAREKAEELAFIRSSMLLEAIPETVRITYANHVLSHYGPNMTCRALMIRKSNLYYHVLRASEETVYEKHDRELRPAIQAICESSPKQIGAEKIQLILKSQGYTASKRKVLELLRDIRPSSQKPKKGSSPAANWQKNDANLLARHFSPSAPNLAWVSDITEMNRRWRILSLRHPGSVFQKDHRGPTLRRKRRLAAESDLPGRFPCKRATGRASIPQRQRYAVYCRWF